MNNSTSNAPGTISGPELDVRFLQKTDQKTVYPVKLSKPKVVDSLADAISFLAGNPNHKKA